MAKIYITLTGTNHYYGNSFLKPGMKLRLVKEPENAVDSEAIRVELEGMGRIGYVANSPYTIIGDSQSAGRIYDKIGESAKVKVMVVTDRGALCKLSKKSLLVHEKNNKVGFEPMPLSE